MEWADPLSQCLPFSGESSEMSGSKFSNYRWGPQELLLHPLKELLEHLWSHLPIWLCMVFFVKILSADPSSSQAGLSAGWLYFSPVLWSVSPVASGQWPWCSPSSSAGTGTWLRWTPCPPGWRCSSKSHHLEWSSIPWSRFTQRNKKQVKNKTYLNNSIKMLEEKSRQLKSIVLIIMCLGPKADYFFVLFI